MAVKQFVILSAAVAVLSAAVLAQQTARDAPAAPSTGTASVAGTVFVNEPNGGPVRRAVVSLSLRTNTISMGRQTITDDQGRFVFANLPAGTYSPPSVAKPGFVPATYGEPRPGGVGTPVTLTDGQKLTVAFKLLRGGVITGKLLDDGRPVSQTNVNVVQVRVVNGTRSASSGRSYTGQTDDRGIYRIFDLAPGDYLVSASPRRTVNAEIRPVTEAELQWATQQLQAGGAGAAAAPGFGSAAEPPPPAPPLDYAPVFYPGTGDATAAATVSVAAGQERSGIDFSVTYVATAKIEGVVLDSSGVPANGVQLNIVPLVTAEALPLGSVAMIDTMMLMTRPNIANGRFSFSGIKPGRYTLFARAAPGAVPAAAAGRGRGGAPALTLWASQDLHIDGRDVTSLELRLQPGLTLRGRVTFDPASGPPPEDLSRLNVRLTPAPTAGYTVSVNPPVADVSPEGTFRLEGIAPGKYVVNASLPGNQPWLLRSARVGEIDGADAGFDVRPNQDPPEIELLFTTRTAELSGRLLDGAGRPSAALSIFLFTVDPQQWSQRTRRIRPPVRAGTDGTFRFTNLLPGEYYLAALSDFDQADIFQPDFLEQVGAAAMKITIAEGEKKVQDIRIAGK